jgi:hypothetical protein
VHTGGRRYLVVQEGNLSCMFMNTYTEPMGELKVESVLVLERGESKRSRKVIISSEGRYVFKYVKTANGVAPL